MSSPAFRTHTPRFILALTLFTIGPMTLPGGPLQGERLHVLLARVETFAHTFRLQAVDRSPIATAAFVAAEK